MDDVYFHEEQRFRQPWLWCTLIPGALLTIGLFVWGIVQQIVYGDPWGDHPMSNAMLAAVGGVVIVFELGMLAALWFACLSTHVSSTGLTLRFVPFQRRALRIQPAEIVSVEARTYRPIREYGGWGIRSGASGRAYNVSGCSGVQVGLADGSTILIGSQRSDELAAALRPRSR